MITSYQKEYIDRISKKLREIETDENRDEIASAERDLMNLSFTLVSAPPAEEERKYTREDLWDAFQAGRDHEIYFSSWFEEKYL